MDNKNKETEEKLEDEVNKEEENKEEEIPNEENEDIHKKYKSCTLNDEENHNNNKSKVSHASYISQKSKINRLRLYEQPVPTFQSSNTLQNSAHNIIFDKQIRFPKENRQSTEAIYSPKILKVGPSPGIGYGNKMAFFGKNNNSPPPGSYKIKSIFEENLHYAKGPSLSFRREIKGGEKTPGPGQYNLKSSWQKNGITIACRNNFYYDEMMKGKVFVSPQNYKIKRNLVESQRYSGISFGYGNKSKLSISTTPGVGSYNLPSSFDLLRGKMPIN